MLPVLWENNKYLSYSFDNLNRYINMGTHKYSLRLEDFDKILRFDMGMTRKDQV